MQNSFIKIVKSDPNLIPEVNEFLALHLEGKNISADKLNNLNLAVSEALSNAMVHGNKLDPNKNVTIKLDIDEDKITLTVKDCGSGFDLENLPNPTDPENLLKDSGRGIYIMKTFIDEVSYNFSPEGTELKLVLYLNNK